MVVAMNYSLCSPRPAGPRQWGGGAAGRRGGWAVAASLLLFYLISRRVLTFVSTNESDSESSAGPDVHFRLNNLMRKQRRGTRVYFIKTKYNTTMLMRVAVVGI